MRNYRIPKILLIGLFLTLPTLSSFSFSVDKTGLVIYYSFDSDTFIDEDVLDLSKNGNDGFLHGSNLNIVEGQVNECLEFPGVGTEYIAVRNLSYTEGIPELSIAVWIKTSQRSMIASWDRSDYFRFAAGDAAINQMDFVAFDICCPIEDWHGDIVVTDDEWHHVAVTFDGETKRIYVDGEIDVEQPTNTTGNMIGPKAERYGFIGVGSEAATFNGSVSPAGWAFKGLMDELFYFHRALSQEEIAHLAKAPTDPFNIEPNGKLSTTWGHIKNDR